MVVRAETKILNVSSFATSGSTQGFNAQAAAMEKVAEDGLWKPTASESSGYVFPSQMFFKYTVEVK